MHKYMRAIGFTNKLSRTEQEKLFSLILQNPDDVGVWNKKEGIPMSEVEKDIAYNIGICLRGEGTVGRDFVPDYFFPYIKGTNMRSFKEVSVERHADKESYAAVCDDDSINLSLIFYLQNAFEYLGEVDRLRIEKIFPTVSFSGLCVSGKVIFPVSEGKKLDNNALSKVKTEMVELARNGDEQAAEAMAFDNINEYQQLSKRIMKEDVYSIVDNAFIPYGVECDHYLIIGDIKSVSSTENHITKERIWILNVSCRGVLIDVCINAEDLLGEPTPGRRFKGEIWLQGYIMTD